MKFQIFDQKKIKVGNRKGLQFQAKVKEGWLSLLKVTKALFERL